MLADIFDSETLGGAVDSAHWVNGGVVPASAGTNAPVDTGSFDVDPRYNC